jgi:hypothetical protein
MSNLIERLRDRYSKHSQELRDEAADEIERLRDVAVAAEDYRKAIRNKHRFQRIDKMGIKVDDALDKLREVGDE